MTCPHHLNDVLTNLFIGSVFLIAAHQDRLSFMSATLSEEYIKYLTSGNPGGIEQPAYLYVRESLEYVLSSITDRLKAAQSTLAMVEFLKKGLHMEGVGGLV